MPQCLQPYGLILRWVAVRWYTASEMLCSLPSHIPHLYLATSPSTSVVSSVRPSRCSADLLLFFIFVDLSPPFCPVGWISFLVFPYFFCLQCLLFYLLATFLLVTMMGCLDDCGWWFVFGCLGLLGVLLICVVSPSYDGNVAVDDGISPSITVRSPSMR